jgi:hypothetical protein
MRSSVLSVSVFFALCVNSANLVRNPGFEEIAPDGGPLAWNEVKPVYRIEDGAGRNGSRGLLFDNSDPGFYRFPGQKIEMQPGSLYRFSVWVRTEGLAGDESGATLCLEWTDRSGQWLGGSYPHGVKGTHEWQLVEGVAKIPENAGSVRLSPYVRKGMTGRAWFDDISVTRHIPPAVGVIVSSAYRDTLADGSSFYFVELALSDAGLHRDKVAGVFSVIDSEDKCFFSGKAEFITDNAAGIEINTSKIPVGLYHVDFVLSASDGGEIGRCRGRLNRVAQLPERKVYIDAHNRAIVDGKPFFPLGMYWSSIKPDLLQTYAQGPFNCLMPYGSPTREQMDLARAAGLKVIYSVKDIYHGTRWAPKGVQTEQDEIEFVRARVDEFKEHPALLAWYINDELPLSMIERLTARRDLMEELDPQHPAWVVLYQYNQVRSYLPSFDIIGTDPYPIPKKPAGMALEWTRVTRAQCWNARALWQVPQVFDWAAYKKGEEAQNSRAPTLDEMRAMAWQCIAGGANGLIFYSFFDLFKLPEKDPFEKRWPEVCAMAREISRYIPVLLSVDPVAGLSWIKPEQVEARAWSYNGETYILIVNGGTEPAEASLISDTPVKALAVEFGVPPQSMESGARRFTIEPLKPVLARIRR